MPHGRTFRLAFGPAPSLLRRGNVRRMTVDQNKEIVRRFYAEIDAGNIDAMDELVAVDYVDHHPAPFPGLPGGREGLKRAFQFF